MTRSFRALSNTALLSAVLLLVGCQLPSGNEPVTTTVDPVNTTAEPDTATVDEQMLAELGMNNLGVEIVGSDWLEVTEKLCAGEILLTGCGGRIPGRTQP